MELDKIVCMDALDYLRGLEDASVDMVVTSPPYNIAQNVGVGGGIKKYSKFVEFVNNGYDNHADDMDEDAYQEWVKSIVGECLRVSKGLVWVNHKIRYRDKVAIHPLSFLPFPLYSEIVWNRGSSFMLNSKQFAHSHEYVFGFGIPHYWDDTNNTLMSVWHVSPASGVARPDHPCPFPIELIQPLIESSCPLGGVVCDPFMGSGTTALAAKLTGRHYIGCDLSQQYVDIANARLADMPQDKTLQNGDVQLSLFGGDDV